MARISAGEEKHREFASHARTLLAEFALDRNTFYSFPAKAQTSEGWMTTPGAAVIEGERVYRMAGTGVIFDMRKPIKQLKGDDATWRRMAYLDQLVHMTFGTCIRAGGVFGELEETRLKFFLVDREIPVTLAFTDSWAIGKSEIMAATVRADGRLINALRHGGSEDANAMAQLSDMHALLVSQAKGIALDGKITDFSRKTPDMAFCVLEFDMREAKQKYKPHELHDFLDYAVRDCIKADMCANVGRDREDIVYTMHLREGRLRIFFTTKWMNSEHPTMQVIIGFGGWKDLLKGRGNKPELVAFKISRISQRLLFGINDAIARPKMQFSLVEKPLSRQDNLMRSFSEVKRVRITG